MWEPVVMLGRKTDGLEDLPDPAPLVGPAAEVVDPHRVGHDRAHALARIERCVRILEDHLHLASERP